MALNVAEIESIKHVKLDLNIVTLKIYSMIHDFLKMLPEIIIGLSFFILFIFLGICLRRFIIRTTIHHRNSNLWIVFARLSQWVFILLGFFIALAVIFPSIKPVDLLAGLGVVSISVGFAFKDILQNFLAGIFILIQQPFRMGDQIKYKDFEGTIDCIDTRTTFLKSFDGRRILIPNSELYSNVIIVNNTHGALRSDFNILLKNIEEVSKASKIILDILKNFDGVLKNPEPEVVLVELAGEGIQVNVRWWTKPFAKDLTSIKNAILQAVSTKLHQEKICPASAQSIVLSDNIFSKLYNTATEK